MRTSSVPIVAYAYIRDEYLHGHAEGHGGFTRCLITSIAARQGRELAFDILMENGAMWADAPLRSLCTAPCEPLPPRATSLWDMIGDEVECHVIDMIADTRCEVRCGDGETRAGTYLFTVSWWGSFADEPSEHKRHHVIALDSGHLAAMPNNRIRWHLSSWGDANAPLPRYRTQDRIYSVENDAPSGLVDDTAYFYSTNAEAV